MLRANCPGCEKPHRLPISESGQPLVCIACGTWFAIFRPLLPPIHLSLFQPRPALEVLGDLNQPIDPPPTFVYGDHEVIVVQGHEGSWGTFAAVACAVVLLGSFITLLSIPEVVRRTVPNILSSVGIQIHKTPAAQVAANTAGSGMSGTPAPIATTLPSTMPTVTSNEPTTRAIASAAIETSAPQKAPAPIVILDHPPMLVRPAIQSLPPTAEELSDQQIGKSIQRGVDYLISQFDNADYEIIEHHNEHTSLHTGTDALYVYALLQAGQASNDPRLSAHGPLVNGLLDALKRMPITNAPSDRTTYARALRTTALAVYDRPLDREFLRRDAQWLMQNQRQGAYTYAAPFEVTGGTSNWDNSNSQYGLLGVWAAAEAGVMVPPTYWAAVEKHWNDTQLSSGGWEYVSSRTSPGSVSMTCAGVASLFVTHDWVDGYRTATSIGRDPFTPELQRGLTWLEDGDRSINITALYWGYTLYGIERVGLASGFKYFGKHNWYPELCKQVMERQHADGSFGDEDDENKNINTAYALIFLSRGRHPIFMNKLRFDGFWSNRPRDMANLSRVASHDLERPVNWQVVPIDHDWTDWTDSPILYIASHDVIKLDADARQKLRSFALAGGMLFIHSDGEATFYDKFVNELAADLFPDHPLTDVPANHPIYSSLYPLQSPPALKMVSNGARAMLVFSPKDISRYWQMRDTRSAPGKQAFELGVNLFVYAAGKRDLRNRLESSWIPRAATTPTFTIPVARLRYDGNWDPEPAAWGRFGNWMQRQTGYGINAATVQLADLDVRRYPFAHLTGTAAFVPTDAQVQAVRHFVESGGVLFVDNCGGTSDFDQAIAAGLLGRAFPQTQLEPLRPDHPLLSGKLAGADALPRPHLRPYAIDRIGTSNGSPPQLLTFGRGHVILCTVDVTSGLLATDTWGIHGYDPAYSQSLMKNAILWTVDGTAAAE